MHRPTNQRSQYFDPAAQWIKAHSDRRDSQFMSANAHHLPGTYDDDLPMDDFDKALLAEPPDCCPTDPSGGVSHMPLPKPIKLRAPDFGTRYPVHHRRHNVQSQSSSSSPSELFSSPTVTALRSRQNPLRRLPIHPSYDRPQTPERERRLTSEQHLTALKPQMPSLRLGHAPSLAHGIQLIETSRLPDRFRSLFTFRHFNAVQSKCFPHAYEGNDNLVLSAPTGSGKTAVMELAICKLLFDKKDEDFKLVYQAPTKSLCSERYRDWGAKFRSLGLQCAELTGDVESANLRNVQQANVIIATPEKWDSVTRKWKDNARLLRMIKLFLVDEVHILKEARGATLEAVVSRMKSVGSEVRFVALSATVPNSDDVATWLGLNSSSQHLPAVREVFDESFRPTELEKHVIGYQSPPNEFILDSMLVKEVPSIIARFSKRKPVMIFCPTQKSAMKMARSLSELWHATSISARLWSAPHLDVKVQNADLSKCVETAVAFHHGGLDAADRLAVEQGFLNGNINIICSTSTLAVGVNLPCYLVILKGTSTYTDSGLQEYSILETTQMLGRAGRPQFETSACAVIMTNKDKVSRYEKLIGGQDILESCLHENLIEHLNAEIGIGTISDISSARRWLRSTFLHVRISRNPSHYKLSTGNGPCSEDDILDDLCKKDLELLEASHLIEVGPSYHCTEFGQAMARYYVKLDTMKAIIALPPKAKQSEILEALAKAAEFKELRWKTGEKGFYKKVNKGNEIRYPIKVDVASPAHKASLIIQMTLGGYLLEKDDVIKFISQLQQDTKMVLLHANRLVRCIIDTQLSLHDATSAKNALALGRSFAAKVWDDTPMQLKQIEGIGDVTARKLASHGIPSVDTLASTDSHKIELILGKNPPFGKNLLSKVSRFPSLLVTVKEIGRKRKASNGAEVRLKCEIGSLNGIPATYFNKRAVYVCFLCETSCGKLIDFRRFNVSRLRQAGSFSITAYLERRSPQILCHVMCDEVAGTHRFATLGLDIPESWFYYSNESPTPMEISVQPRRGEVQTKLRDEFDDVDLNDEDFLTVDLKSTDQEPKVADIDDIVPSQPFTEKPTHELKRNANEIDDPDDQQQWKKPVQLPNGNWTCQHFCNEEKKSCKHRCCKEGVKKPRKRAKTDDPVSKQYHRSMVTNSISSKLKADVGKGDPRTRNTILAKPPNKLQQVSFDGRPSDKPEVLQDQHEKYKSNGNHDIGDFDTSPDSLPDLKDIFDNFETPALIQPMQPTELTNCENGDIEEYECFDLTDCDRIASGGVHQFHNVKVISEDGLQDHNTKGIHASESSQLRCMMRPTGELSTTEIDSEYESPERASRTVTVGETGCQLNCLQERLATGMVDSPQKHYPGDNFDAADVTEAYQGLQNVQYSLLKPIMHRSSSLSSENKAEEQPEKNDHEERQKKKWAEFDPWMYEQFGKHVDII